MAVRRVRSDVSGMTYALIFFIFLALIGIALAVMFYLDRTKAQADLAAANAELEVIARSEDRAQPATQKLIEDAKSKNRSLVNQLVVQNQALKAIIGAPATQNADDIQKDLEGRKLVPLLSTVNGLRAQAQNIEKQLKGVQDQLAQRQAELKAAQDNVAKVKAAAEQQVQSLTAQLTAISEAQKGFEAIAGQRLTDTEARIQAVQEEAAKTVRNYENQMKALQTQIVKLRLRNDELIGQIKSQSPEMPDPTKEADGRIIATVPDRNQVYVNLGRGDHLTLGMTFEVFDAQRGVQVDNEGRPRGVATIEITDIGDSSATARIVRGTPGRPPLVNDIIANQVYDRDRTYKFYVFGEFDLDGDGQYTMGDHDLVLDMIKRWGGEVIRPADRSRVISASLGKEAADANLMPVDTDFLIVGKEPELPRPLPPGETDPARIRESIEQRRRYDLFTQLLAEAKALSVPVLNQNRFLTLVGYYRR